MQRAKLFIAAGGPPNYFGFDTSVHLFHLRKHNACLFFSNTLYPLYSTGPNIAIVLFQSRFLSDQLATAS